MTARQVLGILRGALIGALVALVLFAIIVVASGVPV